MKSSAFTIGEVAARFGLATHVLRYWESEGLLRPDRESGQRRYYEAEVHRIALIALAREAGFDIGQLRVLLSTDNPMDHTELLRAQIAALDRRIADAQATKSLIEHALECPNSFADCPHARARIAARASGKPQPQRP